MWCWVIQGDGMMQVDSNEVQQVKTLIRYSEARSAGRVVGCHNLHFLNMPFYETGLPPELHCREAAIFVSQPALYRSTGTQPYSPLL